MQGKKKTTIPQLTQIKAQWYFPGGEQIKKTNITFLLDFK